MTTQDPAAFFRAMIGEWAAGGKRDADDGGALRSMANQAMAAANVASRSEVDALAARLATVEQTLLRIDGKLDLLLAKKAKKAAKHAD